MQMKNIFAPVSLTRKNHALEHATIHLLSKKVPGVHFAGHSNPTGFFLMGNVSTEIVLESSLEALDRLQKGESSLAIHPGCGTNMAMIGLVPSIFALITLRGTTSDRQRQGRFSALFLSILAGVFIGKKMGPLIQGKVTTDPNLSDLRITEITQIADKIHRIKTSY